MSTKKYKPGDKVKILSKEHLIELSEKPVRLNDFSVIPNMFQYGGRLATIIEIGGGSNPWYRLDIDGGRYYWQNYMFEGLKIEIDKSELSKLLEL